MVEHDRRSVDPPKLVDVLAGHPDGKSELGWLCAWLRQPDGWHGFVRAHGAVVGGTWVPADRLRERGPLSPDEIRSLGGSPAGPNGEPEVAEPISFTGHGPTLGAALADAFAEAENAGRDERPRRARISGVLATGSDVRDRGAQGTAPLRIDHHQANWDRFDVEWNGDRDPDQLEAAYVEDVICADIAFSEPPQFNGDAYTVRLDP